MVLCIHKFGSTRAQETVFGMGCCWSVNAAVGALYQTWLEMWLATCLFWDCAVHSIPSLKFEI